MCVLVCAARATAAQRIAQSLVVEVIPAALAACAAPQVLLRSRALESSVESAVSGAASFSAEAEDLLAQLLLAFSARFDPHSAQRFAAAIVSASL